MAGFNLQSVSDEQATKEKEFSKVIFNDANAGVVEPVTLTVKSKTSEDKEKYPDFKVIYTDAKGGQIDEGFYKSPSENSMSIVSQKLMNLAAGVFGKDYKFQEYNSYAECLQDIMIKIHKAAANQKYRVVVAYGNAKYHKAYLEPRLFGSYLENVALPCSLELRNDEMKERLVMDDDSSTTTTIPTMKASTPKSDLPF